MLCKNEKPLFIFEMANNHQGSLEHGLSIIRQMADVCQEFRDDFNFAFKFQYRDLDTFIHPAYKQSKEVKLVKRFEETRLTEEEFLQLKMELDKHDFVSICTAFDEKSVKMVNKHDYSVIKIASCSYTDWPLLESIALLVDKPVIASTAGAELSDIDNVVSFFRHRQKELTLMHCVAEYPTTAENSQLNQISFLRDRYKDINVGYSTHESPKNFDAIKIAIAQGACVFEKHVGITDNGVVLNSYSANPAEVREWLTVARSTFAMCGIKGQRHTSTEKEKNDLRALCRGVFALKPIKAGDKIDFNNMFFAIPCSEGQLIANDISKYKLYHATEDVDVNQPIFREKVSEYNVREKVGGVIAKVKELLREGKISIPKKTGYELSHHYGLESFAKCGAVIITCINREYCKKLIIMVPAQIHPAHYHKLKEETFCVLYGDLQITLNGETKTYLPGDMILCERGAMHSFSTVGGVVFEEVSSTHKIGDSYYEDANIMETKNRKTGLTYWFED